MSPLRRIDNLLNTITMYRLLLYGLGFLLTIATVFSFSGVLSTSGLGVLVSGAVLLVVCYLSNKLLASIYNVTTNSESYLITALILACILPPSTTLPRLSYIALAGFFAMVSKFVLAYRHRHIFNPAALGAVCLSLLGALSVTWWIGSPYMLPFVAVLGLLIARKNRQGNLVMIFVLASLLMLVLVAYTTDQSVGTLIKNAVLSGPLIFFATIMLTEPATMPVSHYYRYLFAALVGLLYSAQLRFGIVSTSPHMVLIAGNLFAYTVQSNVKVSMVLKEKIKISEQVYDFVFSPSRAFKFIPGQYMEWTLGHKKVDLRGNRRSFTIASSPTEKDIHLGVKFYQPSSSFKQALQTMKPGEKIAAGRISGDFVLPADKAKKLVFIAGGIGITPFRSMVQYLNDTEQQRDVALYYLVSDAHELAYKDVWKQARGLTVRPLIRDKLSGNILRQDLPDFQERMFYISGPDGLVRNYKTMLQAAGIHKSHIITDYFSGY